MCVAGDHVEAFGRERVGGEEPFGEVEHCVVVGGRCDVDVGRGTWCFYHFGLRCPPLPWRGPAVNGTGRHRYSA